MAEQARAGEEGSASKKDVGKAPIYQGFLQYFPRAITAVALVSEYGFRKYGSWGGWRKVVDGAARYTDAKSRHAIYQDIEGPYDITDSGLAHAAQEAWNAMAKLEKLIEERRVDIMVGNDIVDGAPVTGTAHKYSGPV